MKAVALFPHARDPRLVDLPEPPPPTGRQVKLRLLVVGICGTDREIASFEYGAPPPGSDHVVLGNETLAQVVEVGRLAECAGTFGVIFAVVGISQVAFTALPALDPSGLFVFDGVPALNGKVEIDTHSRQVVRANPAVLGTVNAGFRSSSRALHELAQARFLFPERMRSPITRRIPIDGAPDSIATRARIKRVVEVGRRVEA